jgi:hypothetical protein
MLPAALSVQSFETMARRDTRARSVLGDRARGHMQVNIARSGQAGLAVPITDGGSSP